MLAASATEKKLSLFRTAIHPRIINQFRGAVITVCFRAIARMVSAGKRSKGKRPGGRAEKEKKDRAARGAGDRYVPRKDRKRKGDEGMAAARMQFFQFAANNVPSIKSTLFCTAPCRFVSIIYTQARLCSQREEMVDLLDLFRSDYVDRRGEREEEKKGEEDVWFLIPANKQPLLAL